MILISGATGLVGRHLLLQLLQEPQSIRAIYRSPDKRNEIINFLERRLRSEHQSNISRLEWVEGDITDIPSLYRAFEGISQVYHCAGLVSFSVRDQQDLRKVNIEGTANMVNMALEFEVEKFCHLSSVAALGEEVNGKPITEASPRNKEKTYNYYEISKYGAEMEVWRASQEGLSVVIVNPAIIIGPGDWHKGSSRIFQRVDKGLSFKIPRESGWVAVEDVCRAMVLLMNSPITNERFILVGEVQSLTDITSKIAEVLQKDPPKIPLRPWMVYIYWFFKNLDYWFGGHKEITRSSIPLIFKGVNFDNTKIQKTLQFQYTPINKSLVRTAQYYLTERAC